MSDQHQTAVNSLHGVDSMEFGENGPEQLDAGCVFDDGEWLVDITIWEHPELVDPENPVQFDADRGEQIPEASWAMSPQRARELAALIIRAAEVAELFQSGDTS